MRPNDDTLDFAGEWIDDAPRASALPDQYPSIVGVNAGIETFDVRAVLGEMQSEYDRLRKLRARGAEQIISFDDGPVALVFVADLHLGHAGVNYKRVFDEAQIVVETPGMWLVTVGDLVENMILPKLMHARFSGEIQPTKEWAILRHYLEVVAPKLIVSVGGNHEAWVNTLTGIPYFLDVLRQVKPQALYDNADARFTVRVGKTETTIRARHRWRFNSIYNATHGIEAMSRFDADFQIGVGAHTHVSGLVRTFNNHGDGGLGLVCGTYKDLDDYAHIGGFAKPNKSTAVAAIIFEDGTFIGFDNLLKCAEVMRMYRSR